MHAVRSQRARLGALLLLGAAAPALAEPDRFGVGDGSDGSPTITTASTVVNTYTQVTAAVPAGATALTVTSAAGFATNDLVMVAQVHGLSVTTGSGTAVNLAGTQVGRWELGRVLSAAATTVTLSAPLTKSFAASRTQLIRVPEYASLTVNGAGTIVATPWNGSVGGVVAFLVQNTLTLNAAGNRVSANGAGFRGAPYVDYGGTAAGPCYDLDPPAANGDNSNLSRKGEGIDPARYGAGSTGTANAGHAGGGGICHNSGGGGGGNGRTGGNGGRGWAANALGTGPGGLGGAPLTYDLLERFTFGGGGGAGQGNNNNTTTGDGKAGGGVIFIRAGALAGSGSIQANGDGYTVPGSPASVNDGAGGGGAGGTIYLRVVGAAACGQVSAIGGNGGWMNHASDHGPGGGGAGGRILIQSASGTCPTSVANGLAGTNLTTGSRHTAGPSQANDPNSVGLVESPAGGFLATVTAPVISSPTSPLATTNPRPAMAGTAPANATVVLYINGVEYARVTADGAGAWSYQPSADIPDSIGTPHELTASVLTSGVYSAASNVVSMAINAPLDTYITASPAVASNSSSATFEFRADQTLDRTFECTLDSGPWTACTSPVTYNALTQTAHTFSVRAIDTLTVIDPTPATFNWTVDTTAPDTSIASQPSTQSNTASPTFDFNSTEVGVTYECNLDAAGFVPCTDPVTFSSLAEGVHFLQVRAIDAAGNVDPSPSTYPWNIDLTAPNTTITSSTPSGASATFAFSSTEAGSTFRCSIDSLPFATCTTPVTYNGLSNGSHTFLVAAVDPAGNVDATPASSTVSISAGGTAPTITSPANNAQVNDNTPTVTGGNAGASQTVKVFIDGVQVGTTTSNGSGAWSYTVATPLADGAHTVGAQVGNNQAAQNAFVVDTVAPETTLTSTPAALTNLDDATFAFNANEAGGTFQCRLLPAAFSACTSPVNLLNLADGDYTFEVRAIDAAGNVDATPASFAWTVDTTAPDTTLTGTPSANTASTSAAFTFNGTGGAVAFECKLDSGAFASCTSGVSYTGLANGGHTFEVRALDAANNVDATPASFAWTVDTVAPDTTLLSTPPLDTTSTTAAFTFSSGEAGTFECRLGAASFAACTSGQSYSGLSDGTYTFQVRAIDLAGNVDPTPASYTWRVDNAAPDTSILSTPAAVTNATSAAFTFNASESSTFECSLDGAAFASCVSGVSYTGLGDGPHTFQVRAVDVAGNTDATPAEFTWTVDTVAPDTTFLTTPPAMSNGASATFTFEASEAGGSFECSVDGGGFAACVSGVTVSGLADGPHTYRVRAVDAAGNVDASPAEHNWSVDTGIVDPVISTPQGLTSSARPLMSGTAEANAQVALTLDGSALATVTADGSGQWSHTPAVALSQGAHALTAVATDAAGNVSNPANASFTVDSVAPNTTIAGAPSGTVQSRSASFDLSSDEMGVTYQCSLDGAPWATCTSPATYSGLANGDHTFAARAVDAAGNVDATPAQASWSIAASGLDAPAVTSPQPNVVLANNQPTVSGTAPPNTTVLVAVDGASVGSAAADGSGAWSFALPAPLADGPHTLEVATNDGSQTSATTSVPFSVDTLAPDTTLLSGPTGNVGADSATFTFTGSEANVTFECSLDGAPFAACLTPITVSALSLAAHTFEVRAVDAAGNVDATPATRTWTVIGTGPAVPAIASPANGSHHPATPASASGTADPNVTVTVAVNGSTVGTTLSDGAGNWALALGLSLADGAHLVTATATDGFAVTSGAAISRFTIDSVPPNTSITGNPAALSNAAAPSFSFESDEAGVTFECRVDDGPFQPCTSPTSFSGLSDGEHVFQVRAVDAAGNADPTPATLAWSQDTTAAAVSLSGGPPAVTNSTSATFNFASAESGVSFECRVDGGAYQPCTSPFPLSGLSDGTHTFDVRSVDAAGNVSPPQSFTWQVDTVAPSAPVVSPPTVTPEGGVVSGTAEPGSTVAVSVNGVVVGTAVADGNGNWSVAIPGPLEPGEYNVSVTVTDPAGNVSSTTEVLLVVPPTTPPQATIRYSGGGCGCTTGTDGAALPFGAVLFLLAARLRRGRRSAERR